MKKSEILKNLRGELVASLIANDPPGTGWFCLSKGKIVLCRSPRHRIALIPCDMAWNAMRTPIHSAHTKNEASQIWQSGAEKLADIIVARFEREE